ncbi:signal peptidase I [Pseudokineococcus basanitobsidens]|uniref:Signal peptidase I n=1 Tax=Pseudokineococcus basanitobsidens TaxID=1926649 RepID=A0ABU8RKN0_9ACTN
MSAPTTGPATRRPRTTSRPAPRGLPAVVRALGLAVGVAAALALVVAAFVPRLAGWEVFAVTSGSMEPGIPVGSAVAVEPTGADEVAVGDVITFHQDGTGGTTTHRVVAVDARGDGVSFTTQGDANAVPDGRAVPGGAVVGRVVADVPLAGYALDLLSTPLGAGLAAAAVAVAVLAPRRGADHGGADPTPRGAGAPRASA